MGSLLRSTTGHSAPTAEAIRRVMQGRALFLVWAMSTVNGSSIPDKAVATVNTAIAGIYEIEICDGFCGLSQGEGAKLSGRLILLNGPLDMHALDPGSLRQDRLTDKPANGCL